MSEKLLIVEDDKKLNDGIRLALKNDAYFFYQCRTLQEAREMCDAKWTVEALGNIVDNAIKYTACGGNVQIKVEQ